MEKVQQRQVSVGMNKLQQHTHNTTKQIDEEEDISSILMWKIITLKIQL